MSEPLKVGDRVVMQRFGRRVYASIIELSGPLAKIRLESQPEVLSPISVMLDELEPCSNPRTYEKMDFSHAPNMPMGFPSRIQAMAAAEQLEPTMIATARETDYGWTVDIDDGNGSVGSIVQDGHIHWWLGKLAAIMMNKPSEQDHGRFYR